MGATAGVEPGAGPAVGGEACGVEWEGRGDVGIRGGTDAGVVSVNQGESLRKLRRVVFHISEGWVVLCAGMAFPAVWICCWCALSQCLECENAYETEAARGVDEPASGHQRNKHT